MAPRDGGGGPAGWEETARPASWKPDPRLGEGPSATRGLGGSDSVLGRAYAAYCRREALGLLSLVPRDELRGFLARARRWAEETEVMDPKDPLATAMAFCGHLLPLPPLSRWAGDFLRNRALYLDELGPELAGATPAAALSVAQRRFRGEEGEWWVASLQVRGEGAGWRGFVRFRSRGRPVASTADVFREASIQVIEDRFLSFQDETLRAFLRSALP